MKSTVFIIARPGDERRYSQTTEPSPDRVRALRADGFWIIAVSYDTPADFNPQDIEVKGRVKGRTG